MPSSSGKGRIPTMMNESAPSFKPLTRLLLDLAEGRLTPAEVEILESLLHAEGLIQPPPRVRWRAAQIAQRGQPIASRTGKSNRPQ
jgi:hypothetical protein